MSRKKIVAATMTAAALGLAFAGYTATRANGTDEVPEPLRAMPLKADAGYRQNHQVEHNGAVFEWMDASASLDHSQDKLVGDGDAPVIGQDPAAGETAEDELAPVAIEHASRVGPGTFAGFGLAGGAGGGTPKGGDEWSGGRYASSFGGGGFGGFAGGGGGGGGAGTSTHTKGSSGTNDPSADKPHTDAPALTDNGTGDKPGSNDVEGPPVNPNPPAEQQTQNPPPDVDPPPTIEPPTNEPGPTPGGEGNPKPPTNVPEPATLGLLGFGMIAAAALRRRRRS